MAGLKMDVFSLVCVFGSVFRLASAFCSLGSFDCKDIPRYSGRQYRTCLTHQYIQEYSDFRHSCVYELNCWYHCMLEIHSEYTGEVTPDCSCDLVNTTDSINDLPPECYSPSGDDCNWYTDCLQKRYPCIGESASYAVDYAKRFCMMYEKHYNEFSASGRTWIDSVRKCLQVKLVPALRTGQEKTCGQLMDFAFDTHKPCYVNPERDISVCDLPITDYFEIVWTLSEGYISLWKQNQAAFWKAILPTFKQLLTTSAECIGKWILNAVIEIDCFIENGIDNILKQLQSRKRRDAIQTDTTLEDIVFEITTQIAETMDWEEKQVMWFGYPVTNLSDSRSNTSNVTVRIIFAPKAMYDLEAQNATMANVSKAVDELSQAITDGVIAFDLGDGVNVTYFRVCDDNACANATFETVAQNKRYVTEKPEQIDESKTDKPKQIDESKTDKPKQKDESETGLFIGIGVGVVAAICIIIVGIVCIVRRN